MNLDGDVSSNNRINPPAGGGLVAKWRLRSVIRTPIIPPCRTLIFPPLRLNRQGGEHGACREIV
jgi:hypothetical protein